MSAPALALVNPLDGGPVKIGWITNESVEAAKPTYQGLEAMFVHLWSRLVDAAFSADLASRDSSLCEAARKEMARIAQIANVQKVWGGMMRLLADAAKQQASIEEGLHEEIANLFAENVRLHTLMREGRTDE